MDFAAILKNRIDLSRIPFSERSSRIMVFRGRQPPGLGERPADFLTIRLAEHWEKKATRLGNYPARRYVIDDLALIDANGNRLPLQVATYPHEVDIDTSAVCTRPCFVDPETLSFAWPSGTIGIRFRVRAARVSIDRRGGIRSVSAL